MYGYGGTASPSHSNNPFLNANNQAAFVGSRFPDITGGTSSAIDPTAYTQVLNQTSGGYSQQYQPLSNPSSFSYGSQQPQQPTYQAQYGASPAPFQAQSQFGQQLAAAAISGSSYGYLNGQQSGYPQQQQQQQLGPAQQLTNNPAYTSVAQFDPYGPLAQWDGTASSGYQQQQQQQQQQFQPQQQQQFGSQILTQSASSGVSPTGEQHPREFLRAHKAEIEAWNKQSWNRFFTTIDALSAAWEARKTACSTQVQQLNNQLPFAGYYQQQVQGEIARVQQLMKEADDQAGAFCYLIVPREGIRKRFGDTTYKRSSTVVHSRPLARGVCEGFLIDMFLQDRLLRPSSS